jgi:hypothetical protein
VKPVSVAKDQLSQQIDKRLFLVVLERLTGRIVEMVPRFGVRKFDISRDMPLPISIGRACAKTQKSGQKMNVANGN